jgi:hypothetical protein
MPSVFAVCFYANNAMVSDLYGLFLLKSKHKKKAALLYTEIDRNSL